MNVEGSADNAKAGNAAGTASVGWDVSAESNKNVVTNANPGSDMSVVNHAGIEFGGSDGYDRIG